ncbi:MAG: hypothetical protein K6T74_07465 [Geminicoccaceae bacterium]|nr:hypothetical protein [Geminicoccaceae bacterium]
MRSIVRPSRSRLSLALIVTALASSWPAGLAAVPGACWSLAGTTDGLTVVRRVASCDQCRTSGPRAGYKQCCEMIGGEQRCQWVRC